MTSALSPAGGGPRPLRFGAATAERLDGLLEGLTAQDDLDRMGAWVLQCGSGGELLSRVSGLLENRQG